jgi:aspartate aminotransferase
MTLSKLAESLAAPATLRLNATAARLKAEGAPVIHLGGGEPESPAPAAAVQAARAMLDRGDVKYTATAGIPALRQRVASYVEAEFGRPTTPAEVLVTAGAKPAIYAALVAVLDPGDEVVFPAPFWVSYPEMVRLAGGVPVAVAGPDGSHEPRIQDMEAAVTARTRMIILNSPNNPSGAVYSEAFVAGVMDLCERRGLFLLADEIYRRLTFDGRIAPSAVRFARDLGDEGRVILVDGVSKMFGMTGFRVGWAVASRRIIEVMGNVIGQTMSCASSLGQVAALAALEKDTGYVEDLRRDLQGRRDTAVRELTAIPGLRLVPPSGTFYCLPDFRAFGADSTALAAFLLEHTRVVTVPGVDFGREGHLRISYCGPAADVVEGIRRLRWALDPTSPREIQFGGAVHVRTWERPGA